MSRLLARLAAVSLAGSVLPDPGWAYKVTKTTLPQPVPDGEGGQLSQVVPQVEWTATGKDSAVKPGEYEVFRVAAGPKTARLVVTVAWRDARPLRAERA